MILTVRKSLEHFTKKIRKTNQKEFSVEKVVKKKDHKLYVKWKGSGNSFASWVDKKIWLYETSYYSEPYTYIKNKKN